MSQTRRSLRAQFRYRFDNFMSRGGLSVFSALMALFFGAFVLMSLVRLSLGLLFPEGGEALPWTDQMWRVFLQISDAGAVAEDTGGPWYRLVVGILTIFLGLVLFSSLVAFITSQFEARLSELKKGRSRVEEKDHTLILGYSDRVIEIIRELVIAKESEKSGVIVVLADREKDEMDDHFRACLGSTGRVKVVTRSGSTSSLRALETVSAPLARSVILLNPAPEDGDDEEKALGDALQLKTLMSVLSLCGSLVPPLIAEFHSEVQGRMASRLHPGIVTPSSRTILSRLIVQTSRISGLAHVYDRLVGFEGCEMYFYPLTQVLKAPGTYREVVFSFATSTVMGLKTRDGRVEINPPADRTVSPEEEVLVLAEDDSVIRGLKSPHLPAPVSWTPAPPRSRPPEQELVVGWNRKAPVIISEYADYLPPGSRLDLAVAAVEEELTAEIQALRTKYPQIALDIKEGNLLEEEFIASLDPGTYDNVIILTEEKGSSETRDAQTITRLLLFRMNLGTGGSGTQKTQLITEVADSENTDIIQKAGAKDFLISNRFVSKIYAQISESPEIYGVYENLFGSEGCEIYLKPLELYCKGGHYTFAQICDAALARGETALGLRFKAFEEDALHSYGILLNPSKTAAFDLRAEDWVITLAENET